MFSEPLFSIFCQSQLPPQGLHTFADDELLAWQQQAAPAAGLHDWLASLAPGERPAPDGGMCVAQTRTPCPACRTTRSATATGTPCRCRTSRPTSRRARRTRSRPLQPWRGPALPSAACLLRGRPAVQWCCARARMSTGRQSVLCGFSDTCRFHCCVHSPVARHCKRS
jgi:hypothetical protein